MKKTILFTMAIALMIAIVATGILAESKAPETGNVDAEANVEIGWSEEKALKQIEEKYTVGTLHDFGVMDWRSMYADVLVFPLSEYEELDESLQFLNNYDIYLSITILPELHCDSDDRPTVNEYLLDYVDFMREDIRKMIADGNMESSFKHGYTGRVINVVQAQLEWDEIFYAVADYYYGYSK